MIRACPREKKEQILRLLTTPSSPFAAGPRSKFDSDQSFFDAYEGLDIRILEKLLEWQLKVINYVCSSLGGSAKWKPELPRSKNLPRDMAQEIDHVV